MGAEIWAAFGSFLAAAIGFVNLLYSLKNKNDKFKVGFGCVVPAAFPGTMMYVISYSDYPITIIDYGFMYDDGDIESIPFSVDVGTYSNNEIIHYGNTNLTGRGDYFERGFVFKFQKKIIGSYARSITQSKNKMYFLPSVSLREKVSFWNKRRVLIREMNR